MKLIVGLGNPGSQYAKTRHNVGQIFLDYFTENLQKGNWTYEKKWKSYIIETSTEKDDSGEFEKQGTNGEKKYFYSQKIFFLKPQTYMNHSGDAVAGIAKFYNINPSNILVIHDDIDLSVGIIKYKVGGGHAGHNGLKDIISKLGSSDFHRIRIGIGRPLLKEDVAAYVLSRFSQEDEEVLMSKRSVVDEYIRSFLKS